jgi:hypothetical protein
MNREQLEEAILRWGKGQHWPQFWWSVCSAIAAGEEYWRIFVRAHSLQELQIVIQKIQEGQYQVR